MPRECGGRTDVRPARAKTACDTAWSSALASLVQSSQLSVDEIEQRELHEKRSRRQRSSSPASVARHARRVTTSGVPPVPVPSAALPLRNSLSSLCSPSTSVMHGARDGALVSSSLMRWADLRHQCEEAQLTRLEILSHAARARHRPSASSLRSSTASGELTTVASAPTTSTECMVQQSSPASTGALSTGAASAWRSMTTPAGQARYFFNEQTRELAWRPPDALLREHQPRYGATGAGASIKAPPSQTTVDVARLMRGDCDGNGGDMTWQRRLVALSIATDPQFFLPSNALEELRRERRQGRGGRSKARVAQPASKHRA